APLLQGLARVLCDDSDSADAFFESGLSAKGIAATDVLAALLFERALLEMARHQWEEAGNLAAEGRLVVREAGVEDPLVSAVAARVAIHGGDMPAARRELVIAQRLRHLLSSAIPHVAVQLRIELIRVQLALADLAGARTLMGEIDEILQHRP